MIIVSFDFNNDVVALNCETSDDMNALAPIVKQFNTLSFKGEGLFTIEVKEVESLNMALIPIKQRLQIDESFMVWKKKYVKERPAIIKVGVVRSKIVPGSDKLPTKAIEEATRFFLKAAVAMEKYKSGKWDGYINLYERQYRTFPTGLLTEVITALEQNSIKVKVEYIYDTAPKKQYNWTINDGITPDPDQIEAIEAAQGKRGILKAPTGFGKTAVLAKRLMVANGVPTLFVANKKSLLDDAAEEFRNGVSGIDFDDVAQIKDGWFGETKVATTTKEVKPLKAPVVVATIQSLKARLDDPRTRPHLLNWLHNVCKFVMVDETQAVGTKIWDDVLNECWAPYRIFLSATPRRTDGATLKIQAGSGPWLYSTTAEEQIEKGRLSELDMYYQVYDHKIFDENDGDVNYAETYKVRIVENEDRNLNMVVKPTLEMVKEGRFVLVLIRIVDHGHILKDLFMANGVSLDDIMFVWGETPDKIRTQTIERFRRGELKIVIGSTIFDAGVNVPAISGVVLAGAGNSDITLVQQIGRGTRNCDYERILGYTPEFVKNNNGKKVAKILDVLDKNTKFFHKQAKNRYYNACQEFGAKRIHILGGDKTALKKTTKASRAIAQNVDQFSAQIAMLDEFMK